jgi:hypothetical protein
MSEFYSPRRHPASLPAIDMLPRWRTGLHGSTVAHIVEGRMPRKEGAMRSKRLPVLLAALAAAGAVAAYAAATASADGRTLVGRFGFDAVPSDTSYYQQCGPPKNAGFTIVLSEDGQPVTALQPGTYWLTVTDNCPNHNFELRSCPGSESPCAPDSGGAEQEITSVSGTPGAVTVKVHLEHGTYRLFCDAPVGTTGQTHETAFGMYADFSVGGVGQVG